MGEDWICFQLSLGKERAKRGQCSCRSNQDFRRSTAEHYSKNSELIYNAKKMCKCLWGTSARRTGVCFLFAYLKKEVVCSYSSLQKFKLKYP